MDSFDSVFTGRSGSVSLETSSRYVSLAFKIHGPLHSQHTRVYIAKGLFPPEMRSRVCTLSKKIRLSRSQSSDLVQRALLALGVLEYEPVCALHLPKATPLSEEILGALRNLRGTLELIVLPSTSGK